MKGKCWFALELGTCPPFAGASRSAPSSPKPQNSLKKVSGNQGPLRVRKKFRRRYFVGNENSAQSFSDRSSLETPEGRGRPRRRVMDVRTDMLGFAGLRGP